MKKNLRILLIIITIIAIFVIRTIKVVKIHDDVYYLIKLNSVTLQKRGLSNLRNIPNRSGVIFVFQPQTNVSFWMKDMKIPLDIYFLDSNGRVIKRECNISPCNNIECSTVSASGVEYVIEVKPREDCEMVEILKL